MPMQTLKWQDDALILLDQTRLPEELVYTTYRRCRGHRPRH